MSHRANPDDYQQLDLRAHSLLEGVPLHDVWVVDLPGGDRGLGIDAIQPLFAVDRLAAVNPVVRFLFGLRTWLGALFGWDREPRRASPESFVHRLSDAEKESVPVEPGAPEGPFRTLFVARREAISEIINSTVHAFLVLALTEEAAGYRLHWAIYVRPVGRITGWYMRLIDPFRRLIIYPALLRHVRAEWIRSVT